MATAQNVFAKGSSKIDHRITYILFNLVLLHFGHSWEGKLMISHRYKQGLVEKDWVEYHAFGSTFIGAGTFWSTKSLGADLTKAIQADKAKAYLSTIGGGHPPTFSKPPWKSTCLCCKLAGSNNHFPQFLSNIANTVRFSTKDTKEKTIRSEVVCFLFLWGLARWPTLELNEPDSHEAKSVVGRFFGVVNVWTVCQLYSFSCSFVDGFFLFFCFFHMSMLRRDFVAFNFQPRRAQAQRPKDKEEDQEAAWTTTRWYKSCFWGLYPCHQ